MLSAIQPTKVLPRYSCIFISRRCPRACSYCTAKDVRGEGTLLSPDQWREALDILEGLGIQFHCIIGNELLSYPDPVSLVRALKPSWGKYGIYSTFPPGWTRRWLDVCIDAGLYNISGGIDAVEDLRTADPHVNAKAASVLEYLSYCKRRGVPDVHATVTIHRHNFDHLDKLLNECTKRGIWVNLNPIAASLDGGHDFYGSVSTMQDWLIPSDQRVRFRDEMHRIAQEVRSGRWTVQVPPSYIEEVGDRELSQDSWHCSLPVIINIEEDGALRGCNYRGPLDKKVSVLDLGKTYSIEEYVEDQRVCTQACPGCGPGGAAWSYWWMAERWVRGDYEIGDKVFQTHLPGHEYERLTDI